MGGSGGCCGICKIVGIVVAVGAINWGLVGLLQMDLVANLLGSMTTGARAVYIIIGVAGLLKVLSIFKLCPCQKGSCSEPKK